MSWCCSMASVMLTILFVREPGFAYIIHYHIILG